MIFIEYHPLQKGIKRFEEFRKVNKFILNRIIEKVEQSIKEKELPFQFENLGESDEDIEKIIKAFEDVSYIFSEELSLYIDLLYKEKKRNQDLGEELRNSLAIIKGNVDILEKNWLEDKKMRDVYFDRIKESISRIEKCMS